MFSSHVETDKKTFFFQLKLHYSICIKTKLLLLKASPNVFFNFVKPAKVIFRKKCDFSYEKVLKKGFTQKLPSNFGKRQKWCLKIFNLSVSWKPGGVWSENFWFCKKKIIINIFWQTNNSMIFLNSNLYFIITSIWQIPPSVRSYVNKYQWTI